MTAFLIDEMLPPATARLLRDELTRALADWARGHPEPYVGAHWLT
ncbi:hypothetical protein [Humibacillus xanthopallidus]